MSTVDTLTLLKDSLQKYSENSQSFENGAKGRTLETAFRRGLYINDVIFGLLNRPTPSILTFGHFLASPSLPHNNENDAIYGQPLTHLSTQHFWLTSYIPTLLLVS